MTWKQIGRDSFGRFDTERRVVETAGSCCKNCGFGRMGKLFQYRTHSDSGTKRDISGLFCSVGCMRAYHQ